MWTLQIRVRQVNITHTKVPRLLEITFIVELLEAPDILTIRLRVTDWNYKFPTNFQLINKFLGYLLAARTYIYSIVRSFWGESFPSITADKLDLTIIKLGAIRLAKILSRQVNEWLNVLNTNYKNLLLISSNHFIEGSAEDTSSTANIQHLSARLKDIREDL